MDRRRDSRGDVSRVGRRKDRSHQGAELTPRELSVLLLEESQIFVSESSFYRILHERGLLERMEHDFVLAADEFHHKTKFANEMWQTDFTYFKIKGWGWYYLSLR